MYHAIRIGKLEALNELLGHLTQEYPGNISAQHGFIECSQHVWKMIGKENELYRAECEAERNRLVAQTKSSMNAHIKDATTPEVQ